MTTFYSLYYEPILLISLSRLLFINAFKLIQYATQKRNWYHIGAELAFEGQPTLSIQYAIIILIFFFHFSLD